jgi:hypothetical protein
VAFVPGAPHGVSSGAGERHVAVWGVPLPPAKRSKQQHAAATSLTLEEVRPAAAPRAHRPAACAALGGSRIVPARPAIQQVQRVGDGPWGTRDWVSERVLRVLLLLCRPRAAALSAPPPAPLGPRAQPAVALDAACVAEGEAFSVAAVTEAGEALVWLCHSDAEAPGQGDGPAGGAVQRSVTCQLVLRLIVGDGSDAG